MLYDRGVVWACIVLAAVTAAALFLFSKPVAPEPTLFMKPVPVEGITARRMDEGTFRVRWAAAGELPPATVIHEVPAEAVRVPPPARIVKRAALRLDICARHGMRKVSYGKRWRCRR
jgi:hypothetical protein